MEMREISHFKDIIIFPISSSKIKENQQWFKFKIVKYSISRTNVIIQIQHNHHSKHKKTVISNYKKYIEILLDKLNKFKKMI